MILREMFSALTSHSTWIHCGHPRDDLATKTMKRLLTIIALATLTGSAFADDLPDFPMPLERVRDISQADATHLLFNYDLHTGSYSNCKEDPASYCRGWQDGWTWEAHNVKLNHPGYGEGANLDDAEDQETILYGDVTKDPATTKALGFDDAVMNYRLQHNVDYTGRVNPK
jgi:hypothetical protein